MRPLNWAFLFMSEQTTTTETPQQRDRRKRERWLSDIRSVGKTADGRRVLWGVMEAGKPFKEPFAGENTNHTNFNLGRASVSRDFVYDVLEASAQLYHQIQSEQNAEFGFEKQIEEQYLKQKRDNII